MAVQVRQAAGNVGEGGGMEETGHGCEAREILKGHEEGERDTQDDDHAQDDHPASAEALAGAGEGSDDQMDHDLDHRVLGQDNDPPDLRQSLAPKASEKACADSHQE